jgi:tetratricopeptide (TPR) repeat protein
MTLRPPVEPRKTSSFVASAALLLATHAMMAQVDTKTPPPPPVPDRAAAYYHDGLAHMYEEMVINTGRPDYAAQAVEEYKLALNADPTSKYLQDGLADLYFKIGRIREAVSAAQDQVKKDPDDLAAHQLLGKVYLRSLNDMQGPQANEMLQLAIGEYETIAKLTPKDLETHLLLGQLYGLNHDTAKAEAQFKLAQSLDTNSEEAVLDMARLYDEQGEPQQAIQALTAIPADDRSPRINLALGAAYDKLKEYKKAAAAYRAAADDDSDNPDTQHALATALLNDNQIPAALQVYKDLVQADPNDVDSLLKIAKIERSQGDYPDALAALEKAKATGNNASAPEIAYEESLVYDALGKRDLAISSIQAILNDTAHLDRKYTDPEKNNRAIFLDRLGTLYQEANDTPNAIATYKQMIALGGDYVVKGYQGEIDTYRAAHQWDDALKASADLASQFPKDSRVQLAYAMQLADSGLADKAIALANAQLTHTPADRETYTNIAIIDMRLHRSADAFAALDKADALISAPDDHFGIDLLRATIYDRDKQYDKAEAEYKKALAIAPDNASVLNDYGYMLADQGIRLQDALSMIQKAVKLDPQNGAYLDSLGWVYFRLGQYSQAEDNLRQAIDHAPTDPSIREHLGQVYEKTGRLKLAVAQWERSMTEFSHSLPADIDPGDIAKVKRELEDARVKLARVSPVASKKS